MAKIQFATFFLAGELYGVNILQVREVIQDFRISQVPQTAPAILGLMNLRGQIVTAIHLGRALGLEVKEPQSTCVILKTHDELGPIHGKKPWIFHVGDDSVGLVVDEMGEVVEVDEDDMDASPANSSEIESSTIGGVAKLKKELLTVLHLERILDLNYLGGRH